MTGQIIIENYNGLKDKLGYVYALASIDQKAIKFGVTNGTVEDRVSSLQTGNPCEITPLAVHLCEFSYELEKAIHTTLKYEWMRGEWYRMNDVTMLFIWMNFKKILNAHLFPLEVIRFDPKHIRGWTVNGMYGNVINMFESPYTLGQGVQTIKRLGVTEIGAIQKEITIGV